MTEIVLDAAGQALRAGAEVLVDDIQDRIARWNNQPEFEISKPKRDRSSVETDVSTDDARFHWVDLGTNPISITVVPPRRMAFQFQGRGSSYDAKTDGGSGSQRGPRIRAQTINDRSIRPREIVDKTLDESESDILSAMQDRL